MAIRSPAEIAQLLNSGDEAKKELGITSFLNRTHWQYDSSPEDLKQFACKQLKLRSSEVLASKVKRIEPALLWASQDGLEADKLNMVEAAHNYFKTKNLSFPPILVWNFFDSQKMRMIMHDGHHRAYYCYRYGIKLYAVVLEPLGNYSKVEDKFRYAFQIQTRVIDLPVMRDQFDVSPQ
jgi:hypothetical protein